MPVVRVQNATDKVLNICLKQVCPLHFENKVEPGASVEFHCGRVWFTLEAVEYKLKPSTSAKDVRRDNGYTVTKSALTIAAVSVGGVALAATTVVGLAAAGVIGGAAAAGAAGSVAGASAAGTAAGTSVVAGSSAAAAAGTATGIGAGEVASMSMLALKAKTITTKLAPKVIPHVLPRILGTKGVTPKNYKQALKDPAILSEIAQHQYKSLGQITQHPLPALTDKQGSHIFRKHGIYVKKDLDFELQLDKGGNMVLVNK